MRTRVLPDPAGAMIRAGPPRWLTAASWSGASSAAGSTHAGTGSRRPASTESARISADRRARWDRCRRAGRRRSTPRCPVGQHARRRRTPASSARWPPSRAALRPHHQIGSPRAGVVVVVPDEEVEPVVPQLEVGRQLPRDVGVGGRWSERDRVDAEVDDHRGPGGPRLVQLPDDRAPGRRDSVVVDDHHRCPGPGRRRRRRRRRR